MLKNGLCEYSGCRCPVASDIEVFDATSLTIWANVLRSLWFCSFATVTPSLVTTGAPKLLLMTTLRPFGPNVTLTALASVLTPSVTSVRLLPESGFLLLHRGSYSRV